MKNLTRGAFTSIRIPVVCLECGAKFTKKSLAGPSCPRCGGSDVDVR